MRFDLIVSPLVRLVRRACLQISAPLAYLVLANVHFMSQSRGAPISRLFGLHYSLYLCPVLSSNLNLICVCQTERSSESHVKALVLHRQQRLNVKLPDQTNGTLSSVYGKLARPVTAISQTCCYDSLTSSVALFRFPATAFVPGPQNGVGFCWYLTSFTREDALTESGCLLKSVSVVAALDKSTRAGEPWASLSVLTGCILIQFRKRS